MTDQVVNQDNQEIAPVDLTDEQLDKFFDSKGETLANDKAEVPQTDENIATESTTNEQQTDESSLANASEEINKSQQEAIEEEKHARNYQAAMKEERARRQELARQLEETRNQQARMEERFQKLFEIKQQQEQPQPPSYDEDPLGHQQHTIKEMQEYVIKQNQYLQSLEEQRLQQEYQKQFSNAYLTKAQEFQSETPDFTDAYNYLVHKKVAEYTAAGLTPEQANMQLMNEESQVVRLAFQQGVNPAERIYAMAKASGYTKAQQKQLSPDNSNENSEAGKKLEQIQKSLAQNKSLSMANGRVDTKQSLSLQTIAEMDDEEFDKVDWNKVIKAA